MCAQRWLAWGMHLDFAPDMAGGAVFPYLESMANQHFGMVIGKGGADTVTQAWSRRSKRPGGEVHCGKRGGAGAPGRQQGHRNRAWRTVPGSRRTSAVIANVAPGGLMSLIEGQSGDAVILTARWQASSMRPAR
jgi:phytoene dehydrogenase-like protein